MHDVYIDGNNIFSRGWFAADDPEDKVRVPIYILFTTLVEILPWTRILVCWDGKPKNDKKRQGHPQEYIDDMRAVREIITGFLGDVHYNSIYEADDSVAGGVFHSLKLGNKVTVVSSDKDLQQLWRSGRVDLYCLHRKRLLEEADILVRTSQPRWEVPKASLVGVALAIIGDPGDSIPGIPGFGPAKQKKLFKGITEQTKILEAVDHISKQLKENELAAFNEALGLTVLTPDTDPGVPEPVKLVLKDPDDIHGSKLVRCIDLYLEFYNCFSLV